MLDYIIVGLVVALAAFYLGYIIYKKYKFLNSPPDEKGCCGECGHCCENCPFAKYADPNCFSGKPKQKKGGGCCCG